MRYIVIHVYNNSHFFIYLHFYVQFFYLMEGGFRLLNARRTNDVLAFHFKLVGFTKEECLHIKQHSEFVLQVNVLVQ